MEERFDDVVYAAEPLGPRVVSAVPLEGYRLDLVFDNGVRKTFDATALLEYPAFARLKSETFFRLVRVQYGTVCWPGDIDYCADTLYEQSK